jgi:hypothetical protein
MAETETKTLLAQKDTSGLGRSHPHPFWSVLLTLGVLGLAAMTFAAGYLATRKEPPPNSVVTARPTPSLIVAIRDISRLETGEVYVEKVVDLTDTQSRFFGLVEGTDSLLLVAAGKATIGIDLSKVQDGDISMDAATKIAKLRLPRPHVLSTSLDQEHTYVYSRKTSVLARRNEELESKARKEATRAIEKAASSPETLNRSEAQAKRMLKALFTPLGVSNVEITFY